MKDENLTKMEKCSRFPRCSTNFCPLDLEAGQRTYIPGEDVCSFTIKNRKKFQKGLITRASDSILKVIPESNVKMLNKRNQKRWHALHKRSKTHQIVIAAEIFLEN